MDIGSAGSGNYLNGALDEVRLYNTALPSSAITALYRQAMPAPTVMGPSKLAITGSSYSADYSVQPFALASGATQYGDTWYSYNSVGKYLGSTYIRTANGDAQNTNFQIDFPINTPSIVYVLYDASISSKPSWLTSAFTLTSDTVTNSNSTTFDVYKATFSAGTVTLGANGGSSGKAMYSVMFQPLSSSSDPLSSQVAYWRLDEGTGQRRDSVRHQHGGHHYGQRHAFRQPGLGHRQAWQGAQLSGSSQYVNVPNQTDLDITSAISVACWAKSGASNWSSSDTFLSKSNSYSLGGVSGTETVEFRVYISGAWKVISFTPTFNITTWHHYVGTYDGSNLRLYVDGTLVGGPQAQTGSVASNTSASVPWLQRQRLFQTAAWTRCGSITPRFRLPPSPPCTTSRN